MRFYRLMVMFLVVALLLGMSGIVVAVEECVKCVHAHQDGTSSLGDCDGDAVGDTAYKTALKGKCSGMDTSDCDADTGTKTVTCDEYECVEGPPIQWNSTGGESEVDVDDCSTV